MALTAQLFKSEKQCSLPGNTQIN